MTDEGERIEGQRSTEGGPLTFNVGDLYFVDGSREDPRFEVNGMVVTAPSTTDPSIQFEAQMQQRMFSDLEYSLVGPYGREMKFSDDLTDMPTLNMTPEIVAAPDFKTKDTQLFIKDGNRSFKIGEERQLSLVCLTGDQEEDSFVFAFKNSSFEKPVLATLVYTDLQGETRGREYRLENWSDEVTFAGSISIPADAVPGKATLVVNFSETDEDGERPLNFTQVVGRGTPYTNRAGDALTAVGWEFEVDLVR
jgi:hypothetical protein